MADSDTAARNIILLSDGTGASSLSFNKSNVWRIFTTLDLGPEYRQIAFYDDGVGTSGLKGLRMLGGGFGWGLSRNVRQMYEFLCRHYRPGDRIYIFGFSRGAFTARVLAHFISTCGILDRKKPTPGKPSRRMETDRGLRRGVKQAHKSYRRCYWDRAWAFQKSLAKLFRPIRDKLFGQVLEAEEFNRKFSLPKPAKPDHLIEFIGIWDTVDAVGLPVDELSDLLDKWIYPYKFPSYTFSDDVARACHALAIDDERQSFHPVLWDESDPKDAARVKQVWFAGMHSNVGGGYPEDNLGYVSLDWMINEVRRRTPTGSGLDFNAGKLDVIRQRAEPVGKIYDSRRGGAVYYRYKPRYISDLCSQKIKVSKGAVFSRDSISIENPKIHHSVIARIKDSKAGYAALGLPAEFSVVDAAGHEARFSDPAFPNEPAPRAERAKLLERTRDHVFWRRFIYFCLLILTYAILSMPIYKPPIPGWQPIGDGWTIALSKVWAFLFDYLFGMLPGFASYWTDAWIQSPWLFLSFVVAFGVLFVWSYRVEGNIRELSEGAWWHVKENSAPRSVRPMGPFERLAGRIRRSAMGWRLNEVFSRGVLPTAFAALGLYVVFGGGYRLLLHYPFVKDGICVLADAGSPVQQQGETARDPVSGTASQADARVSIRFDTDNPCLNTGIALEAGKQYRVTLTGDASWNGAFEASRLTTDTFCWKDHSGSSWKDAGYPATFKGLSCLWARFHPAFLYGLPARRELTIPWFTLVGEIGRDTGNVFPMNLPGFVFQPAEGGTLYLYVNDAIDAVSCRFSRSDCTPDWDRFYRNNIGSAVVTNDAAYEPESTGAALIRIVEYEEGR